MGIMASSRKRIALRFIALIGLGVFGYSPVQPNTAAGAQAASTRHRAKVRTRGAPRHPAVILCPGDPRCPPIQPPG